MEIESLKFFDSNLAKYNFQQLSIPALMYTQNRLKFWVELDEINFTMPFINTCTSSSSYVQWMCNILTGEIAFT